MAMSLLEDAAYTCGPEGLPNLHPKTTEAYCPLTSCVATWKPLPPTEPASKSFRIMEVRPMCPFLWVGWYKEGLEGLEPRTLSAFSQTH